MTEDEVIALAREAGGTASNINWWIFRTSDLERFTAAIEAKVKADLLAGAGEPRGYQWLDSGHFCKSLKTVAWTPADWNALYTADQVAAAVLREREKSEVSKSRALLEQAQDYLSRLVRGLGMDDTSEAAQLLEKLTAALEQPQQEKNT